MCMAEDPSSFLSELSQFIESDFYSNIVSTFELLVAIIALIIGGKKVYEIITDYKKKQRDAVFGYYVNLECFINRIIPLIISDDGKPLRTLYILSPNNELNSKTVNEDLYDKLSSVSLECLHYLSVASGQIPPAMNYSEWVIWKTTLKELVDCLTQFSLVKSDNHLPGLESEEGIMEYYKTINKTFTKIMRMIDVQTKKFFDVLEREAEDE